VDVGARGRARGRGCTSWCHTLPPFMSLRGLGRGRIVVALCARGSVMFPTPSCVRLQLALGCEACIQKCEHEERKNTTHLSRVRGHPARPSRHPRTARPCTPASPLQHACARRAPIAPRASRVADALRALLWCRRHAACAPVLWGLQGKGSALKVKEENSPEPKVWQVGRGGGMQCSRRRHAAWAWASGRVPSCRRRIA